MYIDKIMTSNVISVSEQVRLTEMAELMRQHELQHLPVVTESGELIGIVAHQDIQKATPSSITTLSVGEANYLLAKITAQQIMQQNVVCCNADTLIEEAGQILRKHSISSLPVVEGNQLVGIVTMEDILDFFLDITGCHQTDATRIAVRLLDKKGSLSQFLSKINNMGGYIISVASPTESDNEGKRICIVRYYADNPHQIDAQLRQAGIEFISENFLADKVVKDQEPVAKTNAGATNTQTIASWVMDNDQFARSMNVQLKEAEKGRCILSLKVVPTLLNAAGVVHGGVTYSLADVAIAIASNTHGKAALSMNASINYLATAHKDDTLIAEAIEISLGKNIATYQVKVKRISDNALTAFFTGTVFRKDVPVFDEH